MEKYSAIIREQLEYGITETVLSESTTCRNHALPREDKSTKKVLVVCNEC